jgi:hypothetical protein
MRLYFFLLTFSFCLGGTRFEVVLSLMTFLRRHLFPGFGFSFHGGQSIEPTGGSSRHFHLASLSPCHGGCRFFRGRQPLVPTLRRGNQAFPRRSVGTSCAARTRDLREIPPIACRKNRSYFPNLAAECCVHFNALRCSSKVERPAEAGRVLVRVQPPELRTMDH